LAARNHKRLLGGLSGRLARRFGGFLGVFNRVFHRFDRGGRGFGEFLGFDGRINDGSIAMIVFFDLVGGVTRDGDEIIGTLGGGKIGLAERSDEEAEEKFDDRIQETEARISEITLVRLPIILGRNVAITDVGGVGLGGEKDLVLPLLAGGAIRFWLGANGLSLSACNRDD